MLSLKQIDVIKESAHDYNILSGVTGSSKSFAVNLRWYNDICTAPKNSLFLQSGNTEESLWDNVTSEMLKIDTGANWLEYKGVANKRRLIVKPTGTQVICIGANNEKAQDRIQGKNIKGWYGDEIVKQPKSFIEMADSRCRQIVDGKIKKTPIWWTCNPDHPEHFIKKDYIDNNEIDVKNWFFGFLDNPTMTQEFIDKMEKSYSGVFYQRMIKGLWVMAEGVIYDSFNPAEQIVKDYPKDRMKDYFIAVDWGWENPLVLLLMGETNDNEYYILDEIYTRHTHVSQLNIPDWWRVATDGYADPSEPGQIDELQNLIYEKGWDTTIHSADNDVIEGIKEVQKYMLRRDNGKYGFYIVGHNKNAIREAQTYRWKTNRQGVSKDEPEKVDDHTCDAWKYGIYTRRSGLDFSQIGGVETRARA